MEFHQRVDVKRKKNLRDHNSFFFLLTLFFCILPSGAFCKRGRKKIRFFFFRLICHIFPPQCVCACVCFHAGTLDLKNLAWFECRFVRHISQLIQFFPFSSQAAPFSSAPSGVFGTLTCIDKLEFSRLQTQHKHSTHQTQQTHTSVPWRHVINRTQSLVITWNPPTHKY